MQEYCAFNVQFLGLSRGQSPLCQLIVMLIPMEDGNDGDIEVSALPKHADHVTGIKGLIERAGLKNKMSYVGIKKKTGFGITPEGLKHVIIVTCQIREDPNVIIKKMSEVSCGCQVAFEKAKGSRSCNSNNIWDCYWEHSAGCVEFDD